jgi:serine/threonine protein kinase
MEIDTKAKFEESKNYIGKYKLEEAIGKGIFGEVYKCKNVENGGSYAVKKIK